MVIRTAFHHLRNRQCYTSAQQASQPSRRRHPFGYSGEIFRALLLSWNRGDRCLARRAFWEKHQYLCSEVSVDRDFYLLARSFVNSFISSFRGFSSATPSILRRCSGCCRIVARVHLSSTVFLQFVFEKYARIRSYWLDRSCPRSCHQLSQYPCWGNFRI